MTDDYKSYRRMARECSPHHKRVRHSLGEYVSWSDPTVHTNTIGGFFSRVKIVHLIRRADGKRLVHKQTA